MNSEVYALAMLTLCGGVCAMIYDVFRALRRAVRHNAFFTAAEDIIFWSLVLFLSVLSLWVFNNGEVRFFTAAGFCIGVILYILLLQRVFLKVFTVIFKNIFKFLDLIFQILLTPLRFLYKILLVPLSGAVKKIRRKNNINVGGKEPYEENE